MKPGEGGKPLPDPERWQRIKQTFHAAAETPQEERSSLLGRLTDGDPELRREVEGLLAIELAANDLLERSVFEQSDVSDSLAGRTIGNYVLEREIGHGGMGTVYLAHRSGTFEQHVALKIIRRGMDTEHVIRRFLNERQILATLTHPHIARLLDGGTTAAGLPYFVMEHVEGIPIDEYCARHALSTEQRLRLFREVCAAVHYAHQKLIVHRDLKPANILVTPDGSPKLLDFGIAKLLGGSGNELTATIAEQRILTPDYASPEQLLGEPISTVSDVYSLGVVLYELLSGSRPRSLSGGSVVSAQSVEMEREPLRPSAAARKSGDRQKVRRLRGDLDNVVMMALRRDPSRRSFSLETWRRSPRHRSS